MKQFFLSFAAMLVFAATGFAQAQVEVFNNTGACDFDVTVTSVDANCNTIAVYGPITINFGTSSVFSESDPSVADFIVNAQLTGTTPPPRTFPYDIHIWVPSSCNIPVVNGAFPSLACTGGFSSTELRHEPSAIGAFPNGIAYINPY